MTLEELREKVYKEELKFYHEFWKPYIELEKLFMETEKYVAISEKNKNAYSIQYNIILQAICSEVDVVIKRLCFEYDNTYKPEDMGQYIHTITLFDPYISTAEVHLELYDMTFMPWKNIGFRDINGKEKLITPYWWDAYIKIKHRRLTFSKSDNEFNILERNIQQSNQKNVLGALSGLYVLEMRCLSSMRSRFTKLFKENGYRDFTLEISNRFNDSIFQESIDIQECF